MIKISQYFVVERMQCDSRLEIKILWGGGGLLAPKKIKATVTQNYAVEICKFDPGLQRSNGFAKSKSFGAVTTSSQK